MTDVPVRWGVLGFSDTVRRAILPSLADAPRAQVRAVAARRPLPEGVAADVTYSGADAYDRLVSDPLVEAVYLALPTHLRAEWAIKAAQLGKHVLCEAPLAASAHDVAEIVSACTTARVVLQESLVHRYSAQHRRVLELIRTGALGDVGLLRVTHTEHLWPAENPPSSEAGAGSVRRVGVYGIDLACWLFGAAPTSVAATATLLPETDVDVAAAVTLGFPADRLAVIDCSMGLVPRNAYEVVGTRARVSVDRPFGSPPLQRARTELRLHLTGPDATRVEVFWDANQYLSEIDAFCRALRGDRSDVRAAEDALVGAQVAEACLQAVRDRAPALVA